MSPYSVVRGMTQAGKRQRGCCAAASTGQKAASFRLLQGDCHALAPHFRPYYLPRSTSLDQLSPRLVLPYTMLHYATSFRDGAYGVEASVIVFSLRIGYALGINALGKETNAHAERTGESYGRTKAHRGDQHRQQRHPLARCDLRWHRGVRQASESVGAGRT